jgi:hypothetical protein
MSAGVARRHHTSRLKANNVMTAKVKLKNQPFIRTTRAPLTPAQILAQQKAEAERKRAERQVVPGVGVPKVLASEPLPCNDDKLDRLLRERDERLYADGDGDTAHLICQDS